MSRKSQKYFQPQFETLEPRQMLSLSTALQSWDPSVFTSPVDRISLLAPAASPVPIRNLTPILPLIPSIPLPDLPFEEPPPSPTSAVPEVPQLQGTVNLAITGDGFFVVQDRHGRQLFTRDGRLRLNDENQLVTQRGDQVMGYVSENGNLLDDLVPLRIPANDDDVSQETTNVYFRGNLTPSADVANVPGRIQSRILVTDEFEIPSDSQFTAENFQVEIQPTGNFQDFLGQAPYSYYVTFSSSDGGPSESRPTHSVGPIAITKPGSRVRIDNLPQPTVDYDRINIYRNTAADPSKFYRVAQIPAGQSIYVDYAPDTAIFSNPELDIHGTRINRETRLLNVQAHNGQRFANLFGPGPGTLSFTSQRGNRNLETKILAVGSTTTVQDLLIFFEEASGIEGSVSTSTISDVVEGRIQITSNLGIENFVQIGLASTTYTPANAAITQHVPLAFSALQSPNGEGTTTEFIVYDSSGTPFTVRLATALVQKSGTSTVYRWYATSPDNQPTAGVGTTIGTGLLTYNGNGNSVPSGNRTIAIQRSSIASPLEIKLDFSQVSGLSNQDRLGNGISSIKVTRQDGFPPGTLKDYAITEKGEIRGVFSNGLEQVLGQIPMATIPDPFALRQVASRLYAKTSASGSPNISSATADQQSSFAWLPPEYYVAPDGFITKDRSYTPTASTLAAASPTSLRYPWIVRSARLKIDGQGFFAIEGRNGRTRFTRDGRFHLNRDQELVTHNELRVLGYGVNENFEIDSSKLKPLSVPLGSYGHQATTTAGFSGFLSPPNTIAAQPAVFESVLFYDNLTVDTKLVDVITQSNSGVQIGNDQGSLQSNTLSPEGMQITSDTTVGQWMAFLEDALGIDKTIPGQQDAGIKIVDGKIWLTAYKPAMRIFLGSQVFSWHFKPPGSNVVHFVSLPVSIRFQQVQYHLPELTFNGNGTSTNFIAYDYLGQEVAIRLKTFLISQDANSDTHRWIATIQSNLHSDGEETVVGNGILEFDKGGTLIHGAVGEIVIELSSSALSPLTIQLDFSEVSGKTYLDRSGHPKSLLNFASQDGFPPGQLQKFNIAANGEILGTFSNRMVRPLGQVLLATFPRPWTLRYSGNQLFKPTFRSGRPRLVEPGTAEAGELLTLPSTPPFQHPRHEHGHRFPHYRVPNLRFRDISDIVSDTGDGHLPRLLRKFASVSLRHRT